MPILTEDQYHAIESNTSALALSIDANAINWRAIGDGDPRIRLLATVLINGSYHHLEAREIEENDDESISFKAYPEDYELLCSLSNDAPSSSITIEDRHYMLFLTPYC